MKDMISVIVPVYNSEKYLPDCMDSLLAQTHENLEIILVDDGSSDASGELCDEYAKKDPRVRVIHRQNGGVSSARNAALDIASGEYIGFVDSDDVVKPTMYAELLKDISDSGSDIAVCKLARFLDSEPIEKVLSPCSGNAELISFDTVGALADLLAGRHFYGSLCDKLFSRETVRNIRLNESIYVAEDFLFTVEAILNAKRVCFRAHTLYRYRVHEASATQVGYSEKNITSYDACIAAEELLRARGVYEELKSEMDAATVTCHVKIMYGLARNPSLRKKYSKQSRKELKKHLNKSSFKLLSASLKRHALMIALGSGFYFAAQGVLKRKNRR